MNTQTNILIEKLAAQHTLALDEYEYLLSHQTEEAAELLAIRARAVAQTYYGTGVFIRGLIEVSNYCRNNCNYCGLRVANTECERFRLKPEEIIACADTGYKLGFRTFVLQGGEDPVLDDALLCSVIQAIKKNHPDCAVTLSFGERNFESYAALRKAGADRYLLRHEAADKHLYDILHPKDMSYSARMACLTQLRDLGFVVGAGFMIGAPGQLNAHLAKDFKFVEQFKPEMCGVGPFIPHHATPYAHEAAGTIEQTCYILSIIRLIHPPILLPATTALGSIEGNGRQKGILAGANVVMPNLSPADTRSKYEIYDNKAFTGIESAEGLKELDASFKEIGYHVVIGRGDPVSDTSKRLSPNTRV